MHFNAVYFPASMNSLHVLAFSLKTVVNYSCLQYATVHLTRPRTLLLRVHDKKSFVALTITALRVRDDAAFPPIPGRSRTTSTGASLKAWPVQNDDVLPEKFLENTYLHPVPKLNDGPSSNDLYIYRFYITFTSVFTARGRSSFDFANHFDKPLICFYSRPHLNARL